MGGGAEEGWVQCKSGGRHVVHSAVVLVLHPGSVAMSAPGSWVLHLEVGATERRRSLNNGLNLGAYLPQNLHDEHASAIPRRQEETEGSLQNCGGLGQSASWHSEVVPASPGVAERRRTPPLLIAPARRVLAARIEPGSTFVHRVESLPMHTQTHGGQFGHFNLSARHPQPNEVPGKTQKRAV